MALLVAGRTVGMCSCNFGSHVLQSHSTAIHTAAAKWQVQRSLHTLQAARLHTLPQHHAHSTNVAQVGPFPALTASYGLLAHQPPPHHFLHKHSCATRRLVVMPQLIAAVCAGPSSRPLPLTVRLPGLQPPRLLNDREDVCLRLFTRPRL